MNIFSCGYLNYAIIYGGLVGSEEDNMIKDQRRTEQSQYKKHFKQTKIYCPVVNWYTIQSHTDS